MLTQGSRRIVLTLLLLSVLAACNTNKQEATGPTTTTPTPATPQPTTTTDPAP